MWVFSLFVCVFVSFFSAANTIGEPVLLEQYVALEDYKKQHHNDISLTNGFTIGVIEKHESGKTSVSHGHARLPFLMAISVEIIPQN